MRFQPAKIRMEYGSKIPGKKFTVMELCVPWTKKTYQSIHLTFQKKIEEEECCLPEEIFSKQKKMKTNLSFAFFVCHLLSCGLSLPQNIFFSFQWTEKVSFFIFSISQCVACPIFVQKVGFWSFFFLIWLNYGWIWLS